jgi:hypothetical protein
VGVEQCAEFVRVVVLLALLVRRRLLRKQRLGRCLRLLFGSLASHLIHFFERIAGGVGWRFFFIGRFGIRRDRLDGIGVVLWCGFGSRWFLIGQV